MPYEVVISYAQEDRLFYEKLQAHLSNLRRQKVISDWNNDDISPGTEWEQQIKSRLNTAQIILLLISADFMNSELCYSTEMELAIQRHDANQARVIPIILRQVDWEGAPFAKLIPPSKDKPIGKGKDPDEAFTSAVKDIRKAIEDLDKKAVPASLLEDTKTAPTASTNASHFQHTPNHFLEHPHWGLLRRFHTLIAIAVVCVLIGSGFITGWLKIDLSRLPVRPSPQSTPGASASQTPILQLQFEITTAPDGSPIGISNGDYPFDMGFSDSITKNNAATALLQGHGNNAKAIWKLAWNTDNTDAETLIYAEDEQVREGPLPFFTLVIITTFVQRDSKDEHATGSSRDLLQGAYIAQEIYNKGHHPDQMQLLIANVPDPVHDAAQVAKQIVDVAQKNNIVGVVGWPDGSDDAINILSKAHIPTVSPRSLNITSNTGGYFFIAAPSIDDQAMAAVNYARKQWKLNKAAIFYDPNDKYSTDLASAFSNHFDGQIVGEDTYSTDQPDQLIKKATSLVKTTPDLKLLYFAGYPADASQLLQQIQGVHVIGGDALYQMAHCPLSICPQSSPDELYFTAPAFPDETDQLGLNAQLLAQKNWLQLTRDQFIAEYTTQFGTSKHVGNPYGYVRADSDVILAYDATCAFLYASLNGQLNPQGMQQTLQNMRDTYGVSGHITFNSDGSANDKPVLILRRDTSGNLHLMSIASG